jgi:hypothetical protein
MRNRFPTKGVPIGSREIARTPRAHGLITMLAAGNAIRRGQ